MRHAYRSSSTHFKPFIQASQSSEALRYFEVTCCDESMPIWPKHSPIRSNECPMLKRSCSISLERPNGPAFGRMLEIRANGCWKPIFMHTLAAFPESSPFGQMVRAWANGAENCAFWILGKLNSWATFRAFVPLVSRLYIPYYSECNNIPILRDSLST